MLKNYLRITFRLLRKEKGYAVINTVGLAVGMASCLLIAAYVRQELSYDRFNEKADRLYRVVSHVVAPDGEDRSAYGAPVLATTLEAEVPEVEAAVRVMHMRSDRLLQYGEKRFKETDILEVDSTFFDAFSYELLRGDPKTALAAPASIVLTESTARKYFGEADPMGKALLSNNERPLTVTGVVADPPRNSHLQFGGLVSLTTWLSEPGNPAVGNWGYVNLMTYALVQPGASRRVVERKMAEMIERHRGEDLRAFNVQITMLLEPVTDIRLRSEYGGIGATRNLHNVRLFGLIAGFILLIACVNFTNLATARSTARAKEVGIRKCVGARRSEIARQFLLEAVLLSAVAFLLAVVVAQLAQPLLELVAGTEIGWHVGPAEAALLLLAVLAVGALAGAYPALVLSRFEPARVLKGALDSSGRRDRLRKALVVVQFAIAAGLIAATAIVFRQLGYMQRQDLGFEMDARGELLVVDLPIDGSLRTSIESVKARLGRVPGVVGVSASGNTPASGGRGSMDGEVELPDGSMKYVNTTYFQIDGDYVDVYGMRLAAGRGLDRGASGDSSAFLLNETAVREFGMGTPEDAVDRRIRIGEREGTVVGVLRDFHISGLREEVVPITLWLESSASNSVTLRLRTGDLSSTMADLERAWQELAPAWPFAYQFLDQQFDRQYRDDLRFGRLFGGFAALAIFIACLGLFGLAALTVRQRTKEIGIRKVLGASVGSLVALLSTDFLKLVLVAFVVAFPVVYYAMRDWLEGFAYRSEISWLVFAAAGLAAVAVALLTVSYQAIRAALGDPVKALRYE